LASFIRVLLSVGVAANVKTYFKGAPFYNAFIRTYPVQVGDYFRLVRDSGAICNGLDLREDDSSLI
jgi:hypothetical protein